MTELDARAGFTSMEHGTAADWAIIAAQYMGHAARLPDRLVAQMRLLGGDYGGFAIDRLQHSLQCATRAHLDGRDEPYVVMALLHDIGDLLGPLNHPELAAAIIQPFVSEELHWICRHHGQFQGYYYFHFLGLDRNAREQFRGHRHFAACAEFSEKYDSPAFDPGYDSASLEFFEPMLHRVMAASSTGQMAQIIGRSPPDTP